jgi:phospholipid-binding lipoprotein MlaA
MTSFAARLRASLLPGLLSLMLLGGCASTNNPRDPLEPMNRVIYHVNDGVDNLLLKPVAIFYKGILPQFARTGVTNFFSNLYDILTALNNLLQGKLGNAASDAGRVVLNSTLGIAGLLDIATEIGLEKHNEDFGQTLGYWGLPDGPYLQLPLFGPSSFRDGVGRFVDVQVDPVRWIWRHDIRTRNSLWGLHLVNTRANLLDSTKILDEAALDPYEFQRDAYLQRRRNLVYDGNPPPTKEDDLPEIKTKPRSGADQPVKPSGAALQPAPAGGQTGTAQPAGGFPPTI